MKGFFSLFYIFSIFIFIHSNCFSQTLDDNYTRVDNTTVGGGWTEVETAVSGAQIVSNRLQLGSTTAGIDFTYKDVNSSYTSTLTSNVGLLTWAFNMRSSRSDPSGFDAANYGIAFVLGSTTSDPTTGDGYAVTLGNGTSADPIRLVSFTGGMDANANTTTIITGNDYATEYLSIRVTYDGSTDNWSLYLESSTSFPQSNPVLTSTQIGATTTNSTFTSSNLRYVGPLWNHNTAGESAIYDAIYLPYSSTSDYFRTLATGNWNSVSTWQSSPDNTNWIVATLVPTSSSAAITVQTAHTITINADVTASSITIAGTGILTFDGVAARAVTVSGDIAITGTGSFITQAAGTFTNTLSVGGNISNAGIFDMSRGGSTLLCNVTFNKNGNQTVSGAGTTTRFRRIQLSMGTTKDNILEITATNLSCSDVNLLLSTTNTGTLKLSTAYTGQLGSTISADAGIWINHADINTSAWATTVNKITGRLRITNGIFNVGTLATHPLTYETGSEIIIEGGTFNLAGRFCSEGTTGQHSITYNQSGGTVIVNGVGNGSTTLSSFEIKHASSSFTMSGGTIIIRNKATDTDLIEVSLTPGTSSVSGGTIQFADASTTVAYSSAFKISSSITLPNILVDAQVVSGVYATLLFSSNATIGGTFEAEANTTVDVNTRTVAVTGASTIAGTLTTSTGTYDANGTFNATGGNVTFTGAGNLNLGSTVTSLGTFTESTSTVSYDASGNQNIDSDTYYHLIINGSGTKTLADALDVNGNLTITAGTLASTSTYDITLAGNWANNGTAFTHASRTVTFDGGAAQTISGSTSTTFYNLTIANTSGGVSLGVNTTATGTVTLTSGKFTIQGYTLTVGTSSTNGSVSGGSTTTYIVACDNGSIGYLKQFINTAAGTAYSFPIGDATNYTPLTFTLTTGTLSSAYLTIYTKASKIPGLNPGLVAYLKRHWSVTASGITSPTYTISYTYVDGDLVGLETYMYPVKKTGNTWYAPTGTTFIGNPTFGGTGSVVTATNTLTWTSLTTFSSFGGGGDQVISLPVELISFTGKKSDINNQLHWTTASELNNDFFTVEKTTDGINFNLVGIENGAGTSSQNLDYSLTDYDVRPVINYYRLVQTDFDGKSTLSEVISIDNREGNFIKEILLKTNILGQEVNEFYRGLVVIVYSDGTSDKVIQ